MTIPPTPDIPQQLATATAAWAKLRRLSSYAAFDGGSLAIAGVLTLVCGGYGSPMGLLMSTGLIGTGVFEVLAVGRLRRLSPNSVTQLAWNQLVLAGVLILYAVINLVEARHGGGSSGNSDLDQALAEAGGSGSQIADQVSAASQILYLAVIAFTVLVQGGTAIYYRSRRSHFQRYLEETPDWILQMQRDRGTISL